MEDRLLVAVALLAVMTVAIGWATVRFYLKRRAFRLRQAGRGKNISGNVTGGLPAE